MSVRAKADEAITLIRQNFRLQGGEYVDPAATAIDEAQKSLGTAADAGYTGAAGDRLGSWRTTHDEVIRLVNDNDLRGAVAAATGTPQKPGPSNTAFAAFDTESNAALKDQAAKVSDGLAAPRTLLLLLGLLAVVLGLVAAAASFLGVSQRLEEYR